MAGCRPGVAEFKVRIPGQVNNDSGLKRMEFLPRPECLFTSPEWISEKNFI